MRAIEQQATDASLHRLGRHSVAIVNSIRTVGHDPITGKRADTEEPGSGCTLRWGAHYFVLTAGHVVEKARPGDIRVFCPPPDMKFRSSASLEPQDIMDAVSLKDESALIHRCAWEDFRHFLIPYDDATRGKHPRGISGAAMWWESDQKHTVWRPNFKFAGICTASYKRGSVVQVVKASVVRRFLAEVFGTLEYARTRTSRRKGSGLKAEVEATRYAQIVQHWLARSGFSRQQLIDNADWADMPQNHARSSILRNFRGFQANRFLFAGFPEDAVWRRMEIEPHETSRLRYARYRDWVLLSGGTRKPSDLVANLSRGQIPIEDAKRFRAIQDAIVRGRRFPELIAAEGPDGELILIEGHSRATAYAACGLAENLKMFLASSPSMPGWVFY